MKLKGIEINRQSGKAIRLTDFIPKSFYRDKVWLDCASGNGYMVADYLLFEGGIDPKNYFCIDIHRERLDRLMEAGCPTFCVDLETVDIKTFLPKLDIVLSIETLEHLEEMTAIRLVEDFVSLLNKDGIMLLSFPEFLEVGKPKDKDHINKHQPDVNKYIKRYRDCFSSMMKSNLGKSHLLVFSGKK